MAKPNRPAKGTSTTSKPKGSPDRYKMNGRAVSGQNPSNGGNAFSAYGLSEKMKARSRATYEASEMAGK